jgi:hypothetical protein
MLLSAQTAARGDAGDGGAPAADATVTGPDAGTGAGATSGAGAGGDAAAPIPPPVELAKPPELAAPSTSATLATPSAFDAPLTPEAEPPRPITRRLWFWLAITGVIIGAVAIGIAVHNPSVSRPDCPAGYACPL